MAKKKEKDYDVAGQFDGLVNNAVEYLKRSIDETSEDPKHAIIDFYTSVELFIKARLMKEHWTLILTKPGSTTIEDFLNGDFQSISLLEAKIRLSAVLNEEIGKEAFNCFDDIRNHRNRLIHFHNTSADLKELVTKEVLKGLYFLQTLIFRKWIEHFEPYEVAFNEIREKSLLLREFLAAKYGVIEATIHAEIAAGTIYRACVSCGFYAAKKMSIYKDIFSSHCNVCEIDEKVVRIPCPTCSKDAFVKDGEGSCEFCIRPIDIDNVLAYFTPEEPKYGDQDSLEEYDFVIGQIGRCDECGDFGENTLHPMDENGKAWFCISCQNVYEYMTNCTRCGVLFPFDEDWGLICRDC